MRSDFAEKSQYSGEGLWRAVRVSHIRRSPLVGQARRAGLCVRVLRSLMGYKRCSTYLVSKGPARPKRQARGWAATPPLHENLEMTTADTPHCSLRRAAFPGGAFFSMRSYSTSSRAIL